MNTQYPGIFYKKDGKYTLEQAFTVQTRLRPGGTIRTTYITLSPHGQLAVFKGFKWDGVSGGIIDNPYNQLAGCVHDAIYRLFQKGLLPNTRENLTISHKLFKDIWISTAEHADMSSKRYHFEAAKARYAYIGLRIAGAHFSEDIYLPKVKRAP